MCNKKTSIDRFSDPIIIYTVYSKDQKRIWLLYHCTYLLKPKSNESLREALFFSCVVTYASINTFYK